MGNGFMDLDIKNGWPKLIESHQPTPLTEDQAQTIQDRVDLFKT